MAMRRLHAGEFSIDDPLVRRLLAGQFPAWADLPIRPVASIGTVNAIYRLGEDMVVRLPRVDWAIEGMERELRWLPWLAPRLSIPVPSSLAGESRGRGIRGRGPSVAGFPDGTPSWVASPNRKRSRPTSLRFWWSCGDSIP